MPDYEYMYKSAECKCEEMQCMVASLKEEYEKNKIELEKANGTIINADNVISDMQRTIEYLNGKCEAYERVLDCRGALA